MDDVLKADQPVKDTPKPGDPPQADSKENAVSHETLIDGFFTATEAYEKDPSEANKTALLESSKKAKEARTKALAEAKAAGAPPQVDPKEYEKLSLPKDSLLGAKHLQTVKEFAIRNKLPLDQARFILERDNGILAADQADRMEKFKQARAAGVEALKKEYGADFEKKIGLGKKAVDVLEKAIPGLKAELDTSGLTDDPMANKLFNYIFEALKMGDDKFEKGDSTPQAKPSLFSASLTT